ncbi:MAG: group 1 truncated hemoglobin [Hyphomonadaceae bacterium]|nr:group 1 truncated hemoglobin [Hyphomonadaceae bacterium]
MANSLFEKYGGFSTIHSIVIEFYNSVLDSDVVGPFFDGTDMESLIDHQTKFISFLLGGPVSYPEAKLKAAHSNLDIQSPHFDTIKSLLGETLTAFDVEEADIEAVLEKIETYRTVIAA